MIRECIVDNTTGEQLDTFDYTERLCELLNELHDENKDLEEARSYYQENFLTMKTERNQLKGENKELKEHIKELEKEVYLEHMRSMFSTVKSFNGDVSKRYYYSEETDTLYDSANNYGQYDKILDKKEVAMLLNEYETLLNGGDVE